MDDRSWGLTSLVVQGKYYGDFGSREHSVLRKSARGDIGFFRRENILNRASSLDRDACIDVGVLPVLCINTGAQLLDGTSDLDYRGLATVAPPTSCT